MADGSLALELLQEAEKSSAEALENAKPDSQSSQDLVFSPGSAFAFCHAQCQMAIAGIEAMSATFSEAIKALFNLRKAYLNIQSIIHEAEKLGRGLEDPIFTNSTDAYIQSGANLCFGVILVTLSFVPPFLRLPLRLLGAQGDLEKGLQLLWQASRYSNLHGAIAGLLLLGAYLFIRAELDIMDMKPYPNENFEHLLAGLSARYPKSQFLMPLQARMASSNCNLEETNMILNRPVDKLLRGVEAMTIADKGYVAMFLHDYANCASNFVLSIKRYNRNHNE